MIEKKKIFATGKNVGKKPKNLRACYAPRVRCTYFFGVLAFLEIFFFFPVPKIFFTVPKFFLRVFITFFLTSYLFRISFVFFSLFRREKKFSQKSGGAGYRSLCLTHAKRALYHLSYTPNTTTEPNRKQKIDNGGI